MKTIKDCFHSVCSRYGEKKAITIFRAGRPETEISYTRLDQYCNQMAVALMNRGVCKGDRIVLYLEKSLLFVIAHLAIQKIGAITVPFNPGYKKSEISYLIRDAEPALILTDIQKESNLSDIKPDHVSVIPLDDRSSLDDMEFFRDAPDSEVNPNVLPEDPGLLIYTSGTTGEPKGVTLTQKNLVHDLKNIQGIWEITCDDVLCHVLPFFHVHGLCFALHTCLMAGSHILLLDAFSPETVINLLKDKGSQNACSIFMAVPAMYGRLIDFLNNKILDFSHLRLLVSGSAPLSIKDFERIKRAFGMEPLEREGMSETGMNFSNPIRGTRKPGSIGLPLPGLEVRIVDPETLKDLETGQTGEFWLKGEGITPGYWRKPGETAQVFIDGWFRTGDLGKIDNDGYYYLTDRIKHIIISGGENISPKEIQNVINQFEGVIDSSVVGIEDEKWGEKVVAAVVAKPGININTKDIAGFCKEHLHAWKCPKEIILVDRLPKNTMGKVLQDEVKNLFRQGVLQ